jgi:replicative DNA helicase
MGNTDAKLLPQDLESERAVIASMLLHPPCIDSVMALLSPDKFYADPHKRIVKCIAEMWDKGKNAIDTLTVGKELEKRKELAEVGGVDYLVKIMESVPHAAHAEHYAGLVREAWFRRSLLEACTDSCRDVYASSVETAELTARIEQRLHDLIERGTPSTSVTMTEALCAVFDEHAKERRAGLKTGYGDLDRIVDGLMPGTLNVLAARPSMGKTALALNLLRNVGRDKSQCLFISLEQPQLEIAERLLALESEVGIRGMRNGELMEAEQWSLSEASQRLSAMTIQIDDRSWQTPTKIGAVARLHKRRHGLGLLVIDYLQLIEPDDVRQPREQQVATATRRLKCLAKDLDVPILLLAQLNRQVDNRDDKAPKLADLRESGAIEQDADQVWFVWRPEVYEHGKEAGVAYVKVAKNRNGPLGTVKFAFRAPYFRFDVLAQDPEADAFAAREDSYNWN